MYSEQEREGKELVQRWFFCWLAVWLVLPHLPGVLWHLSWFPSLFVAAVIVWLHSLVMSNLGNIASALYHFMTVGIVMCWCALCWPSLTNFSSIWSGALAVLVVGLAAAFSLVSIIDGRNRS